MYTVHDLRCKSKAQMKIMRVYQTQVMSKPIFCWYFLFHCINFSFNFRFCKTHPFHIDTSSHNYRTYTIYILLLSVRIAVKSFYFSTPYLYHECSFTYCKNSGVFDQYFTPQFSKFHSSM